MTVTVKFAAQFMAPETEEQLPEFRWERFRLTTIGRFEYIAAFARYVPFGWRNYRPVVFGKETTPEELLLLSLGAVLDGSNRHDVEIVQTPIYSTRNVRGFFHAVEQIGAVARHHE